MTSETNEQRLDWHDAIDQFGTPTESSILKDEEWENAKNENRVVSLLCGEAALDYQGKVGLLNQGVMCRVVFSTPLPRDVLITNVQLDDIELDFSKPAEEVMRATARLLSACCEGDVAEAKSAIAAGGDVNYCDDRSEGFVWPLTLAMRNGHKNCVEVLIDAGASLAYDGEELWRWATLLGYSELSRSIEQRGIRAAPQKALLQAVREGKCDAVQKLFDAGADINAPESIYSSPGINGTPLTVAILAGHDDAIDLLLHLGAEVNLYDEDGEPRYTHAKNGVAPWVAAAARGLWDLCSKLESKGAKTDPQTALVFAARIGNPSVFGPLIDLGADPNRQAAIGDSACTPLESALESHEIGRYSGGSESGEDVALESLRCSSITELIKCGSDYNTVPAEWRPLMLRAVDGRHANVIEVLLEHGASVDIADEDGETALLATAGYNEEVEVICAQKLLLAGADPNAVDNQGRVPLMRLLDSWKEHYYCGNEFANEHVELAKWLIAFGARMDATCKNGRSIPLYVKRVIREAKKGDIDTGEIMQFREWIDDENLLRCYGSVFVGQPESAEECFHRARCAVDWLEDPELAARQMDRAAEFGADVREIVSSGEVEMATSIALIMCQIDGERTQSMIHALSRRLPADEDSVLGQEAFDAAMIHGTLGDIKVMQEDYESALTEFDASVRLNPSLQEGRWGELHELRTALGDESLGAAHRLYLEAYSKSECGDYSGAEEIYRNAIDEDPEFPWAYNNLAWQMATCPDPDFRDGKTAVELAKRASSLSGDRYHGILDTLAAAHAEAGNFAMAVKVMEKALEAAPESPRSEYEFNLERYRSEQKWAPYEGDSDCDEVE